MTLFGFVDVFEVDGGDLLVVAGLGGSYFIDGLFVALVSFVLILLVDLVVDDGSALIKKIFHDIYRIIL